MRTVNSVTLLGNVGQDPKVNVTGSGKTVANFTLATSFRLKDSKEDVTEWHRLVAWGRLAEIVRDYVARGAKLYIEGRLQTRSYDSEGTTKYVTEIVVSDLSLLGSKTAERSKAAGMNGGTSDLANRASDPYISDDEIPF